MSAKQSGFIRDDRGAVSIWVAMGMGLVIGFSALAIDMGNMYMRRSQLQVAADSAALAALSQLADPSAARSLAHTYVDHHLPAVKHGNVLVDSDVEFGNWDSASKAFTANGAPVNALRVSVHKAAAGGNAEATFFASMMGIGAVDLSTSSVAIQSPPASCVLALDSNASDALKLDSNASINAPGCQVTVNSTSSSALSTYSNAQLSADDICVSGDYDQQGGSITPAPNTSCPPASDPLASLAEPSSSGCTYSGREYDSVTDTASPGVYCGGLTLKGNANITLDAGVYVIKGGDLFVDSNSQLTGDGVMFFLTEGAAIHVTSNTVISLTGPTSGPYAGIVFFQDRDYETTHFFDSNNFSTLEGVVYLPTGIMKADSNTQIGSGSNFSMYIAKQFEFNSNSGLAVNTDYASSGVPLPPGMAGASRLAM